MTDIQRKKLGAKILMWAILTSMSLNLVSFLRDGTEGNGRLAANIVALILIPASMIYFGLFAAKNGDRAEYLLFGKFLTEETKGVKTYET